MDVKVLGVVDLIIPDNTVGLEETILGGTGSSLGQRAEGTLYCQSQQSRGSCLQRKESNSQLNLKER